MISFERTTDWPLVKKIVTHPMIYPHMSDDFAPAAEAWKPIQDESFWYVLVREEKELLGLWILHPENAICWKIHTCLLPSAHGEKARAAVKYFANWVWENTPCHRVNTDVPIYNRLAYRFAKRAGMTEYGLNPRSWMKNGRLHHQIMLGISRPEKDS